MQATTPVLNRTSYAANRQTAMGNRTAKDMVPTQNDSLEKPPMLRKR